jgi:hypothetical protein
VAAAVEAGASWRIGRRMMTSSHSTCGTV